MLARLGQRAAVGQSILLAIVMAGMAIAGEALRPTQRLAELKPPINLAEQIPRRFAGWTEDTMVVPVLPDPTVQAQLNVLYSSTLARTYVNPAGQRIMLSIAYGSDQSSEVTAVHRPEFCYSAQGFKVTNLGEDVAEFGDRKLTVRRLTGTLDQRHEPITYWITLDETATLPGVGRKIEQVRYGLRGVIPDGLLFRVSSIGHDDAANFRLQDQFLRDLMASVAPAVRSRYFGS